MFAHVEVVFDEVFQSPLGEVVKETLAKAITRDNLEMVSILSRGSGKGD